MKLKIILVCLALQIISIAQAIDQNQLTMAASALATAQNNLRLLMPGIDQSDDEADVSCLYTNSTNLPIIITMTKNNIDDAQEIAPGKSYAIDLNSSASIDISVHANLSAISQDYDSDASYDIVIDSDGKLALNVSTAKNKTIINKTTWSLLVSTKTADNDNEYITLNAQQYYIPADSVSAILIIPLIPNTIEKSIPLKACTVVNKDGFIDLQFAK